MLNVYASSESMLQIEVISPEIRGIGSKWYVDYTIKMKTTLPTFNQAESIVHRCYSAFEWLHKELEHADIQK
ncbi:unnamed protein product [Rotaria sp. Silwood2]|nr:unnamed protein product [Rotaria sp. Silwood2]CAF3970290.1 unnamed protein product [Rotaria sp. Silwood2]